MPPKGDPRFIFFEGEDLAQNRESLIFYAVKHFKGLPPLFKSTKQTDKRKAKKELPRLFREHLEKYQDGKRAAGDSPTVTEVIEEVEHTETPSHRKRTQRQHKFYFGRIRDELKLGPMPIERVSLKIWTDRIDAQRALPPPKKGRKRMTYKDYAKHMNILLRYAYEQKYVSHLVTFPNPDKKTKVGTVLTIPELKLLWEVMGETTRDQFVLGYECAMRKLEALHLTWDRVDLDAGQIILRAEDVKTGSKTGKGREFYMTPHALERLRARKALQDKEKPSRWVFPSETGKGPVTDNKVAWTAAKERALKKMPAFQHWARWHDLRHTAITRMLVEQGMNITHVSEYVGTSVDTLQRVYLHSRAEHTRGVNVGLQITDAKPTGD